MAANSSLPPLLFGGRPQPYSHWKRKMEDELDYYGVLDIILNDPPIIQDEEHKLKVQTAFNILKEGVSLEFYVNYKISAPKKLWDKVKEIYGKGTIKPEREIPIKVELEDATYISQKKYTQDLLKKFDSRNTRKSSVPISPEFKESLYLETSEETDSTHYRGIIGSLMHLTATRPDITYAVTLMSKFCNRPKKEHRTVQTTRSSARLVTKYGKSIRDDTENSGHKMDLFTVEYDKTVSMKESLSDMDEISGVTDVDTLDTNCDVKGEAEVVSIQSQVLSLDKEEASSKYALNKTEKAGYNIQNEAEKDRFEFDRTNDVKHDVRSKEEMFAPLIVNETEDPTEVNLKEEIIIHCDENGYFSYEKEESFNKDNLTDEKSEPREETEELTKLIPPSSFNYIREKLNLSLPELKGKSFEDKSLFHKVEENPYRKGRKSFNKKGEGNPNRQNEREGARLISINPSQGNIELGKPA